MKRRPFLADALIGIGLTLFVAGSYLLEASFLESLELKAYDWRSDLRQAIDAGGEDIAVVAIDDDSIARIGRWPWPRSRLAEMLDLLAAAKPKVVGLDIVLSEAEQNQGLGEIRSLRDRYEELVHAKKIVEKNGVEFSAEFSSAVVRLDTDAVLRASLARSGNVVLPMFFDTGGIVGAAPDPVGPAVSNSALTAQVTRAAAGAPALPFVEGRRATAPLSSLAEAAAGIGHVNLYPDFDGVLRREYPAVKYGEEFFPSFALQLAMRYLGFQPGDVKVIPGRGVEMGTTHIPLDERQSMLVSYTGPYRTFRYYSFHEVLNGKVALDVFKDKIVILGPSASAISTLSIIPVAHSQLPGVEFVANVVENILHLRFLVRPDWAPNAELAAIFIVGLFVMLVLPRLRAFSGAAVSTALLLATCGAATYLFVQQGHWVKAVYPAFLLAAGYLVVTTKRFLMTEKGKELVEASAIETNKMLGLSFQGQGMLDLAFDKFRLCPLDDSLKDLLYNLGLDLERKRQYNKAAAVYEHIGAKDPAYKDIKDKIKVLQAAAQGAIFGGIGGAAKEGTVLITGGASKPTLGRYEIEKELGRGAMGVVYLGKDPKINRLVAIKTMLLEDGSEAVATRETKERFFREAESAGTLNHPNIVRIFDAGEEHDICYIAMELLDGHDFTRYTSKDNRLPPEEAMESLARVADALDYAHAKGIVHRDIKPANIMRLKDGAVRVTDFGIARITASSKTATGTVMGTPSYMSPEQVAGKKVDGRSDLFSLGVALFELLTGEKPFKGGDGIGALLFQIAGDPEPEPKDLNPALPACASRIIHKALKKNPDERYQRGSELASDLRACILALKQAAAPPGSAPAPVPAVQASTDQTVPISPASMGQTVPIAASAAAPARAVLGEGTIPISRPGAQPQDAGAIGVGAADRTASATQPPNLEATLRIPPSDTEPPR